MDSYLITGARPEERREKALEISSIQYQVSKADAILLEPELSLGIGEIRDLKHKLSLKPYQSKWKSAIIDGAEKLTFEAQTCLLKTLEEPPANTIIILTSPQDYFLLPTIVSRCQIIKLEGKPEIELTPEVFSVKYLVFSSLFSIGIGERIKMAGEIAKTREETIKWLEEATAVLRQILLREFRTSVKTPPRCPASPKRKRGEPKDSSDGEGISTDFHLGEVPSAHHPRSLSGKCETRVTIIRRLGATKRLIEKNINFRLALEVFFLSLPINKSK